MFWILIAILVAIAVAFILPALFKKNVLEDATREQNIAIAKEQLSELERRFESKDIDEKNYLSVKEELEYALLNDLKESDLEAKNNQQIKIKNNHKSPVKTIDAWLILLLTPLIAIPVYLNLGNLNFTKHLDSKNAVVKSTNHNMPLKADGSPDVEKLTQQLQKEMESNPTDPKGWYMLGRAYMMINRVPEAVKSFEKSLALRPDSAETMLSLADSLSMNNEGKLIGKPRELVKKALLIEPQNVTALWLSGMAASQEGVYQEAISQWQKLLPFIENNPEDKTAVLGLIDEARNRLTDNKKSPTASKPDSSIVEAEAADTNKSISLEISISQEFKNKVSPQDSVFIYAKAMNGPPMPLAAVRKLVSDFPIKVMLDDDMAMIPSLKLSSFNTVVVGARISKSGQAIATKGDFFTEKPNVSLGDNISLEINQIVED